MKKALFVPFFFMVFLACSKDPGVSTPIVNAPAGEAVATDRGPNCANCEIRFDNLPITFSAAEEFRLYKHFNILTMFRYFSSLECGGQNMYPGVWYPVTLDNNVQYLLTYTFKQPCAVLHESDATFSIRTGGAYVTTFPLHTGNTAATNPASVAFYRSGCTVSEGVIE